MVIKQASPPATFDMGSARNTPFVPSPQRRGRRTVSGATMKAFLKREKNIADLARPSAWETLCPTIWNVMKMKDEKYMRKAGTPYLIRSGSLLNM